MKLPLFIRNSLPKDPDDPTPPPVFPTQKLAEIFCIAHEDRGVVPVAIWHVDRDGEGVEESFFPLGWSIIPIRYMD